MAASRAASFSYGRGTPVAPFPHGRGTTVAPFCYGRGTPVALPGLFALSVLGDEVEAHSGQPRSLCVPVLSLGPVALPKRETS